jgi:type I restriction enzyme S subunit
VLERVTASTQTVRLSEAVEINPKPDRGLLSDDLDVSFVPMAMVEAGTGNMAATTVRKYAEVKKGYTYFRDGDVLFAKITPCMENGKMAVARDLHNGIGFGSTEFHVLRSREGVDPHYVYHFVASSRFRAEAAHYMTGAVGQKRVPISFLERAEIPLPPIEDQRRIVAEIEKQLSRLDEAVANLKRVKANLKRYKAAVLKAAVEGRLVPTEAELARREGRSYETGAHLLQRILEIRRNQWKGKGSYKQPAAPHTADFPNLPEGWVWTNPDMLAKPVTESIGAGPFGTIFKAKDFRSSGVPIIFLRHVAAGRYLIHKPGYMDRSKWEELFQPYSVFGGELLITKLGDPPGVCAIYPMGIGPAMVTPDVIKMAADEDVVISVFLMHYFNSETSRRFATGAAFGTTRLRLTLPIFREMPVPLPPRSEQQRIVDEVDRRMSLVREVEAEVDANLRRSSSLKSAVLQRAFSSRS